MPSAVLSEILKFANISRSYGDVLLSTSYWDTVYTESNRKFKRTGTKNKPMNMISPVQFNNP